MGPAGPQGRSGSSSKMGGPASGSSSGSSGKNGGPIHRFSSKKPQDELDVNMTNPYDKGGGAGAVAIPEPVMRTQAEQVEINNVCQQAELFRVQMEAKLHSQQQDFAQFMGQVLQQEQRQQPHVSYSIFKNSKTATTTTVTDRTCAGSRP